MNATDYLRVKLPKGASVYAEDGWLRIVVAEPEQPTPAPSSIDADENHRVVDGVRYRAEDALTCTGCDLRSVFHCIIPTSATRCTARFRTDGRSIIWVRE